MTRYPVTAAGNKVFVRSPSSDTATLPFPPAINDDRRPMRVQSLDVPGDAVTLRDLSEEEQATLRSYVRCGIAMWVVHSLLVFGFVTLGVSELALYGSGFSFVLPAVYLAWLLTRWRRDYWEASYLGPLLQDRRGRKVAAVVAENDVIRATFEVLPNTLFLWTVDGKPAPWRNLRVGIHK